MSNNHKSARGEQQNKVWGIVMSSQLRFNMLLLFGNGCSCIFSKISKRVSWQATRQNCCVWFHTGILLVMRNLHMRRRPWKESKRPIAKYYKTTENRLEESIANNYLFRTFCQVSFYEKLIYGRLTENLFVTLSFKRKNLHLRTLRGWFWVVEGGLLSMRWKQRVYKGHPRIRCRNSQNAAISLEQIWTKHRKSTHKNFVQRRFIIAVDSSNYSIHPCGSWYMTMNLHILTSVPGCSCWRYDGVPSYCRHSPSHCCIRRSSYQFRNRLFTFANKIPFVPPKYVDPKLNRIVVIFKLLLTDVWRCVMIQITVCWILRKYLLLICCTLRETRKRSICANFYSFINHTE